MQGKVLNLDGNLEIGAHGKNKASSSTSGSVGGTIPSLQTLLSTRTPLISESNRVKLFKLTL